MKRYHSLSDEEAKILLHKSTELPGTGEYEHHDYSGIYCCRQCDQPLYLSNAKFSSGCGWPSFDEEIAGAIIRQLDADGRRTEIICSRCRGHLGHVFRGEAFTKKNTRHCVNSGSMRFVGLKTEQGCERAIFAGGCFWGVEYLLAQLAGVISVRSGYAQGHIVKPSYEEVCSGLSGHAECVEVIFDTNKIDFKTLAQVFLEIHDPCQQDCQGPDVGSQYRSGIYYLSLEQARVAKELLELLTAQGLKPVTEVLPAAIFYPAEDYHQHYYQKTGQEPYCHARVKRFS